MGRPPASASCSYFQSEYKVWVSAAVTTLLYSSCIHVSSYFCLSGFIKSIFIITSRDLWPRSNWYNGNYITVYLLVLSLLFVCCCCCPFFLSLYRTCSFPPIHSDFVSLTSSIIMFHVPVMTLLLWAHILAGHIAFLLTWATYTITLERGSVYCMCVCVRKNCLAQLHHDWGLSQVCVWMNPEIVNKLDCTLPPKNLKCFKSIFCPSAPKLISWTRLSSSEATKLLTVFYLANFTLWRAGRKSHSGFTLEKLQQWTKTQSDSDFQCDWNNSSHADLLHSAMIDIEKSSIA